MQRRLIKFCILLSVFGDSLQAVKKDEHQIQLMRAERNPVEDAVAHILQSCFPHFKNILNLANLTELRSKYIFESLRNFQLPVVSVDVDQHKKVQLKGDFDVIITTSKKFKEEQLTKLDIYEKFHLFTKGLLFIINYGLHDCFWSLIHFNEARFRQYAKTYFFCIKHKNDILILTHTPGVTWAPPVWNRSRFGKQISGRKKNRKNEEIELFIYQRYYSKDNICQDFTYDVSKNLNNYQLKMVSLGKKYNRSFFDVKLLNILKKVFGVTPSLQTLSSSEIHKLMRKNRFDILLESQLVSPNTRSEEIFSIAFPIMYYSIVIVTNNRGLMTPLEKIYNYYVKLLPVISELDLHQPKKVVHTGYYAKLVRKNSPFKTKINDLMIVLMHSGLAQKWTNDKIADEMRGIKIKKARALIYYRPIDFDDLFFSFVLLGVGLFCSAACFVTELFLKKFTVREKQKRARGRWNVPKVLVKLKQKNSSDDIQVAIGEPRYFRRWRNIFRRVLKSFTRYLLRHW
ncbi:hypothetical protein KQX54_013218 [Cotesia glomerata]|uniref:Ionotropic receptor n=1 Tax=Cotesia glomerata TaxID=32391 RepID=A0AAV7J550_COTGL|nr:hypothetical protein KQX54_013218 [Cotesia glomerata]